MEGGKTRAAGQARPVSRASAGRTVLALCPWLGTAAWGGPAKRTAETDLNSRVAGRVLGKEITYA